MKIIYTGKEHSILGIGVEYEVYQQLDDGVRVKTRTGFCGIPQGSFKIVGDK